MEHATDIFKDFKVRLRAFVPDDVDVLWQQYGGDLMVGKKALNVVATKHVQLLFEQLLTQVREPRNAAAPVTNTDFRLASMPAIVSNLVTIDPGRSLPPRLVGLALSPMCPSREHRA